MASSASAAETTEALAAKLLVMGFDGAGEQPPEHARRLIRAGVGGVILFKRNIESPEQVAELCRNLKREAGDRPLLIMVDQEGGRVARLSPPEFTEVPSARRLSTAEDCEAAAAAAGTVLGREVRAVNIDMNLAPVMDVDTNPANPVIGDRSFSREPAIVASMGAAFTRALQAEGVAACAKHFPGHGDTSQDSHLELPTVSHSMQRLSDVELPPFQAAADADVAAIMVAHVTVPALDRFASTGAEAPGSRPASMSAGAVGYLRHHMNYDGVIVTDDMEMGALREFSMDEAVTAGMQAGVDMFLVCHTEALQTQALAAMVRAVREGDVSEEQLRAAAARVDRLMRTYVAPPPPRSTTLQIIGSKENRDLIANLLRSGLR